MSRVVALPEVRSLGKHLRIKCTESLVGLESDWPLHAQSPVGAGKLVCFCRGVGQSNASLGV